MFSVRDFVRVYLDYYKHGGVRYSLQNDVVILRAVESILQKQLETPDILLNEIEVALSRRIDDLARQIELGQHAERLGERVLLRQIEEVREPLQQIEEPLWQIEELLRQIEERLRQIEERLRQIGNRQSRRTSRIDEFADQQARRNPELALLAHLAAYLECKVAVDIGANIGDFSDGLLEAGYTVFAFEPYQPIYHKLTARFQDREHFTACDLAISATDGTAKLNLAKEKLASQTNEDPTLYNTLVPHSMPEGLEFSDAIEVRVRSLESLRRSAQIPAELGVVKIDTEGNELNVIQGMGSSRAAVIMAEFWSEGHVFASTNTFNKLPDLVAEMRKRGRKCHIAIYRLESLDKPRFISNAVRAPEGSWGNVLFFEDTLIFEKALQWCDMFL
jgi:FkbM family methyltransferase